MMDFPRTPAFWQNVNAGFLADLSLILLSFLIFFLGLFLKLKIVIVTWWVVLTLLWVISYANIQYYTYFGNELAWWVITGHIQEVFQGVEVAKNFSIKLYTTLSFGLFLTSVMVLLLKRRHHTFSRSHIKHQMFAAILIASLGSAGAFIYFKSEESRTFTHTDRKYIHFINDHIAFIWLKDLKSQWGQLASVDGEKRGESGSRYFVGLP